MKSTWFEYKVAGQNLNDRCCSVLGVEIASRICCALGQKELFYYFVTELQISINILTAPISAGFLDGKQITSQLCENGNIHFVDPIEIVMMLNQNQFLQLLLERIAVNPSFSATYDWLYPVSLLPRQESSTTVNKQSYQIEASCAEIIRWLKLAAQFGACECAEILLRHFPSEIARGLYLAKFLQVSSYPHTSSLMLLRYAFMQGSQMFALFESLDDTVLSVLSFENFGRNESEHYSPTSYHSLDFNYIFCKVEESLEYMAAETDTE